MKRNILIGLSVVIGMLAITCSALGASSVDEQVKKLAPSITLAAMNLTVEQLSSGRGSMVLTIGSKSQSNAPMRLHAN